MAAGAAAPAASGGRTVGATSRWSERSGRLISTWDASGAPRSRQQEGSRHVVAGSHGTNCGTNKRAVSDSTKRLSPNMIRHSPIRQRVS
jgi:hypothetical protein